MNANIWIGTVILWVSALVMVFSGKPVAAAIEGSCGWLIWVFAPILLGQK